MKNLKKNILIAASISFAVLFSFAMTEQWRFSSSCNIVQVVADGYGGCAIVELETNGYVNVSWFDKKGFFGVKIDMITGRQLVVRFSNK